MLIDIKKSLKGKEIRGVIHVGAHYGQEIDDYEAMGIKYMVLFEPLNEAFRVLENRVKRITNSYNCILFNVALSDFLGTSMINISNQNQGQSNSILRPLKHKDYYPDIVFTEIAPVGVYPLDYFEFDRTMTNFLVMDVQGAEGLVLKGATETLKHIDIIYTEVNTEELYEGCVLMHQLDEMLPDFKRVETKLTKQGWGDAIYLRR